MKYKLLGNTGLRVSELCLGAMIFGDGRGEWGARPDVSAKIVETFAEAGGNFIDTANYYAGGESERLVGEIIHAERDRWVLSTKYTLSMDRRDPNAGGNHRKNMWRSLEASLKRLNTDYIDVFWVHIWDALTPVEETLRALDDLVRSGRVHYVGISDTPAWLVSRAVTQAEERGWTRFCALQVPYSLIERTVERDLLPMARALDLAVTAWSPLGGGLLTGKYGSALPKPEDTRVSSIGRSGLTERNLQIADLVNAVATERGVSSTQVALAWVRAQQQRSVVIPIVGVRTVEQLLDNLGTLDVTLTDSELQRLDEVSAIELGFPYDFKASTLVYGDLLHQIDDHRGLIQPTK
jgi:aryl-alcohol dehydrogenase-like predicted oxidoreductase